MFVLAKPSQPWSQIGLRVLIGSIIAALALSVLDGILKGPIEAAQVAADLRNHANFAMIATWVSDFRYLSEQAIEAATIFFVGAKFFETRSIFTVGFDKLDAAKIAFKGPDEDNIVWVGQRYGTRVEAEVIAEALAVRLKESTVA